MILEGEGLAELHTHLGGSVASEILWCLAHEQGISLPVKDYWEFDRLVTVSDPRGVENLDALDAIYHWTELIQSSPLAVERSVHDAIGGAYRSQGRRSRTRTPAKISFITLRRDLLAGIKLQIPRAGWVEPVLDGETAALATGAEHHPAILGWLAKIEKEVSPPCVIPIR